MKYQRRFETDTVSGARELAQISTLIADLHRAVAVLDVDIETEEERVQVRDPAHPAYPTLARSFRVRRYNLNATISGLQNRMQLLQHARTSQPVGTVAA